MKINRQSLLIALTLQTLLTGCASITKDANQPVRVETYSKNNVAVTGANCIGKNERGEFHTESSGVMRPHRSGENLLVTCTKEGEATGFATLISRANGGMFGNILFGGGIGAIIDHNKGTAYSYPDWIRVIMGDDLVYDRKNNKENEIMLGQSASPEELKKVALAKADEEKAAQDKALAEQNSAKVKAEAGQANP
ncbi:MAG: hypothetical protein HOP25_00715 [Methylotenera sp.]|nr:hypothetical protein [Methylotenera sp.]